MTAFAFPSAGFGFEPFFEPFLQAAAMHAAPRYVHKHQHQHQHQQQQQQHQHHQQQPQRRDQQKPKANNAAPSLAPAAAKAAKASVVVAQPLCNIYETDAAYWIQVDVPGATEPDVSVHEGRLVVKAAVAASGTSDAAVPEGARLLRRERPRAPSAYERAFALPEGGVDADRIEARLSDAGVLTIVVPKAQPQAPKPKKIRVVRASAGAAAGADAAAQAKGNKAVRFVKDNDDDDEGSVEDASDDHEDRAAAQMQA
jgi:HSP20 family molecular chaperone IbpA